MTAVKILALLKKNPDGLPFDGILAALGVNRRDKAKLLEVIRKLEARGDVRFLRGRFLLAGKTGLVRGRFVTARPGFGFVTPEGGGGDIFVPARHARGALPGDDVAVVVNERGKFGKPEGRVERILRKERTAIVGIYRERGGAPFLQPFDSPSQDDIPLRPRGPLRPDPGMVVEADRSTMAVTKVYGMPEDPGVDTGVVVGRYGLRRVFPEDAMREAEAIPDAVPSGAAEGRRDFRDWPSVTIDGEKAQDFDDAVSVRPLPSGGWLLGVHIADVSHYVRPGTALDREAFERGTSVYFPGLTLPMLPEKLSNGLCSLRPRETRLAVSVLMEVDGGGRVRSSEFVPSLIRTAHRMTYASVFRIFEGDAEEARKYADVVPDLRLLRGLARALRERRLAEGSLDFDLVEPELVYEEGKLLSVAAAERNEAHRLIEELMVAANVAVAAALSEKNVPAIYRIHPPPGVGDLEKLRDLILNFGLALPDPAKVRSQDLQRVLEKAKGLPGEKFIGIQVLRAMKLAVYAVENVGHYGLAKVHYTHFTSPIRRYPDLAVHRILKGVIAGGRPGRLPLDGIAAQSSERERNAAEAEQALVEWRIFRFLKDRLGDEFRGVVVDVVKAGLVVEVDEYFVSGLLPFSVLRGDHEARPAARRRRPRRPRKTFDLGDEVRVLLVSCDPALRRMSFVPAADPEEDRP